MLKRNGSPHSFSTGIALVALVFTFALTLAAAGTNAAGFSFLENVKEFLGLTATTPDRAQNTGVDPMFYTSNLIDPAGASLVIPESKTTLFANWVGSSDYTVTTTGNAIIVTDLSGNGDTLTVSEPSGGNIRFAAPGRSFSVDGGAGIPDNSGDIPLTGVTQITLNGQAGDDTINVSAFTGTLPSLTINGGTGDDTVNINGDITFAADASLDADLQNDDATPGTDALNVGTNANILTSGSGTVTVKVSKNIALTSGSSIESVDGAITIEANQQAAPTAGNFFGVDVNNGLIQTTGTGTVTVKGKGGNSASSQYGVRVQAGGNIIGGTSTLLSVTGTGGGTTGGSNFGVQITGTGSTITSNGANVSIAGNGGGTTTGGSDDGFRIDAGSVSAGGGGSVTVIGQGGSNTGNNRGILFNGSGTITSGGGSVSVTGTGGGGGSSPGLLLIGGMITSGGGNVTVTGVEHTGDVAIDARTSNVISTATNGGTITMIGNGMSIDATATISAQSSSSITLRQRTNAAPILLGGNDVLTATPTLGLTDAELDRVTAGTLNIGDANSGAVTISSDITRPAATVMNVLSGANIDISGGSLHSNGGNVTLQPGTNVFPSKSGVDVATGAAQTLGITSGKDLKLLINGTTADSGYTQLNIAGLVDVTGVILNLAGSAYVPGGSETFTIVNNDGADAITGTFSGLTEGATVSTNFLGSGLAATISYIGGDGNDCVITVAPGPLHYSVTTTGSAIVVTDLAGNGDTLTVSEPGSGNIKFAIPGRNFSVDGGANIPGDSGTIPLSGVTQITVNGQGGNDIINVSAFTATLPSLTINGGNGDDTVNLNGSITFVPNANLDLDMQNDTGTPGVDVANAATNAKLKTSGTGTITVNVSKNVAMLTGSSFETVNGGITVETNQQAIPTAGIFDGVTLTGATLQTSGSGNVVINSRSGSDPLSTSAVRGLVLAGTSPVIRSTNTSANAGQIMIVAIGGDVPAGAFSYGISLASATASITSVAGAISITGTGGKAKSSTGALASVGVQVGAGASASISSTGTGAAAAPITIIGSSGDVTFGAPQGVRVDGPISTVDGDINITGTSANGETADLGVSVRANITATGAANVNLTGTAGTGSAGGPNHGVNVRSGAIVSVAAGAIAVTATGGSGPGGDNAAFNLAPVTTGELRVTGNGSVTVNADTININTTNGTINAGANAVTLRQKTNGNAIDLGSATDTAVNTLELSDAELDRVTAGTLNIGNANSGTIAVSNNIMRPAATAMNLVSNGDVTISGGQLDTGGATLFLDPGISPFAVKPTKASTDVTASTLSFGSDLAIAINGTTADTQYNQLNVVGAVDITGVDLLISGSYVPTGGETFTIVENDSIDAITGTFVGLAEGATISNFLGSGLDATISYTGGTGNDCVITVDTPPPPDYAVTTTGSAIVITDLSGNGDMLFVSEPAASQIRFDAAGRTFSVDGAAFITGNSGSISRVGITSITVNGQGGDDSISISNFSSMQSLTINGGTGNDAVNINQNVTFNANANLDVDLQNDDASPGSDQLVVSNAVIQLSGTGSVVARVSRNINLLNGDIFTVDGPITLEANQQAVPTAVSFHGIDINNGGVVEATGTGVVTLNGKGGNGANNIGVFVRNAGSLVRGGTTPGSIRTNVTGRGGAGSNPHGIQVDVGSISSNGGNVYVQGLSGAGTGANNYGVVPINGGTITSGGNGNVIVEGTGGTNAAGGNVGVIVHQANGLITSGGTGVVSVTGVSAGPGPNSHGVQLFRDGRITSGGTGAVNVFGTGGGSGGHGVFLNGVDSASPTRINSGGGPIMVDGTPAGGGFGIVLGPGGANNTISSTGNAAVTLIADTMLLDNGNTSISAGTGTVRLRQRTNGKTIDMGGADSGTQLGLTDIELDRVSATGTLQIGDINTGAVNVSAAITQTKTTNIFSTGTTVLTGGDLGIFGTVNSTLSSNNGGTLRPGSSPGVINSGNLSYSSGSTYVVEIGGATPGNGTGFHDQLNVTGTVALGGATLTTAGFGGFSPANGSTFVIISNDGADAVTGTFSGLAEGGLIANFAGTGRNAVISYVGGDGNDVVLTAQPISGTIQFSTTGVNVNEVAPNAVLTVTRTGGSEGILTASYSFADSTATGGASCMTAGVDYVNTGGMVSFPDGNTTSQTINVPICDDTIHEPGPAESFTASLDDTFGDPGGSLGTANMATVTIEDNDAAPAISIGDVSQAEGDAGTTSFTFSVALSNPSSQTISVNYATMAGLTDPATGGAACGPGVDYQTASGMLTFISGDVSEPATVTVCGDVIFEPDETFTVDLNTATSSPFPGNASISDGIGDGTIENDDESVSPVITYTPIPATASTSNPTVSATITDNVAVAGATIFWKVDSGTYSSNACVFSGGTAQNGTWNCTTDGMFTSPSAISYYITATDAAENVGSNPSVGAAAPNLYTIGSPSVPAGTYTNVSLAGGTILGGDVTVTGTLTLSGIVTTGSSLALSGTTPNTLTINCGGSVAGAGAANYVDGIVRKNFCDGTPFSYPVGTTGGADPGYSPVLVTPVAPLPTVGAPGNLTIDPEDATLIGLEPTLSASRNWDLNGTGLTANMSFTYLPGDVTGIEASYQVIRRTGTINTVICAALCLTGPNTVSVSGVSSFSRWGAGHLAPTAANATVGGRVLTSTGRGIYGARVVMIDPNGTPRMALTNMFGYYRFTNVPVGNNYVFSAFDKRYQFVEPSIVRSVGGDDDGINFVALSGQGDEGATRTYFDKAPFDFDGDGFSDASVFRDSDNSWYIRRSSDNTYYGQPFGLNTDRLAPADFDGDGRTDIAVFRPSEGNWYVWLSHSNSLRVERFGSSADVPVPSDFDGDGLADLSVWRAGKNVFVVRQSSDGQTVEHEFENTGGNLIARVADYDGDGKADAALFDPTTGNWQIRVSKSGKTVDLESVGNGEIPVLADFDGDGKADPGVLVSDSGTWTIRTSRAGEIIQIQGGGGTDIPLIGDFDGDGRADTGAYRNGTWLIRQSITNSLRSIGFGLLTDKSIPSIYLDKQ